MNISEKQLQELSLLVKKTGAEIMPSTGDEHLIDFRLGDKVETINLVNPPLLQPSVALF